jgi:hypothetical protein
VSDGPLRPPPPTSPPPEPVAIPSYDKTTAEFMAQWSALVSDAERARLLDVVNQFCALPDASRRVAVAMVYAIELITRPELIP